MSIKKFRSTTGPATIHTGSYAGHARAQVHAKGLPTFLMRFGEVFAIIQFDDIKAAEVWMRENSLWVEERRLDRVESVRL